jgi:hypothetical protein
LTYTAGVGVSSVIGAASPSTASATGVIGVTGSVVSSATGAVVVSSGIIFLLLINKMYPLEDF